MKKTISEHFSPRASLCALAAKIRTLKLFETISEHVHIHQKTVKHKPIDKLCDAFIAILAGAHGLVEINTRLRTDIGSGGFVHKVCRLQKIHGLLKKSKTTALPQK
jgi:hypothetical protein